MLNSNYTSLPFHFMFVLSYFLLAMIAFWWEQMGGMFKVDLGVATVRLRFFCLDGS